MIIFFKLIKFFKVLNQNKIVITPGIEMCNNQLSQFFNKNKMLCTKIILRKINYPNLEIE